MQVVNPGVANLLRHKQWKVKLVTNDWNANTLMCKRCFPVTDKPANCNQVLIDLSCKLVEVKVDLSCKLVECKRQLSFAKR